MKAQPLVISTCQAGILQARTFDDIDGPHEAPFGQQLLAVASRRLAEKTAILAFEGGGNPKEAANVKAGAAESPVGKILR